MGHQQKHTNTKMKTYYVVKPSKNQLSKQPIDRVLSNVAAQFLELADDFQTQSEKTKADTFGESGEELTAISQFLGPDAGILMLPPLVNHECQPAKRIAGLIQTLRAAAAAFEPVNEKISTELADMITGLTRV
jgi:hypothetical protein